MLISTLFAIFLSLQCSDVCSIKVPIAWDGNSDVQNDEFSVESFKPQTLQQQKKVPVEYFQYTAQKPRFAADVAAFHGVQSPEQHYKAYPVRPYTGKSKPETGKHQLYDPTGPVFSEFQKLKNKDHVSPVSSSYNIFHPYKAEEPALQEIYKDPVLQKIRDDLRNTQQRLQNYEKEAGEPNVSKDEYLESPEETDRKKFPPYVPQSIEVHRSQRRPIYYDPPMKYNRHHKILNQKLRHPLQQSFVKIRPASYHPLQKKLHRLRQQHALTYDDERNQYPQLPPPQQVSEYPDGYDIYEKGKEKYTKLRNNIDESINKAVVSNRPNSYENAELVSKEKDNFNDFSNEEEDFVPVKNYAQVRKTETTKHLPREAAFRDAESYEEIQNAPRLKEAVKSTKAQTVYSEEGYEDSAYDHAGEQKHASDHEGHGGFLKENEVSGGKYKTPSFSGSYQDGGGSIQGDKVVHDDHWKNKDRESDKEDDHEDFSDDEENKSIEADIYHDTPEEIEHEENSKRRKRENDKHDPQLRDKKFKVPELNLNSTFLTEDEIQEYSKKKIKPNLLKVNNLQDKYPYYFKNLKNIEKDSPLRYAENLKLIPKKSKGGTEFYDSRAQFLCPEVDEEIDPVPEKLKNGTPPDESEMQTQPKGNSRLKGLGDKIDCLKLKYFGDNPLDSPFFQEEIISNPEPITLPSSSVFRAPQSNKKFNQLKDFKSTSLFDNLKNEKFFQDFFPNKKLPTKTENDAISAFNFNNITQNNSQTPPIQQLVLQKLIIDNEQAVITKPIAVRTKRSASFVYEPYNILRKSHVQDSKKTTTTSNISPLIKQLQSSRVADVVTSFDKDQPVKRNVESVSTRSYKNIGKSERLLNKNSKSDQDSKPEFIDVHTDARRGEPKYEIATASNHKSEYTPVINNKTMTLQNYKSYLDAGRKNKTNLVHRSVNRSKPDLQIILSTTKRPFFDVSHFLPAPIEVQKIAASEAVRRIIRSTKPPTVEPESNKEETNEDKSEESSESGEEYDEYEDDEKVVTTTTTTRKPAIRRRVRSTTTTTTTSRPSNNDEKSQMPTKLRLITRFNTPPPDDVDHSKKPNDSSTKRKKNDLESRQQNNGPKYEEKKRKSTKSTLVTDSQTYGEDASNEDELRKDEVDAMIGVKHDMKEYTPEYEIKEKNKNKNHSEDSSDESKEENDYESNEDSYEDDESEEESAEEESTTNEPIKQTLLSTTEPPMSTVAVYSSDSGSKPIIRRKKIEFHTELPANKSSPSNSQFKQHIKEIEIVKEMPIKLKKKNHKHKTQMLELYKDENLAKDVNLLSDVEIFKQDLKMNGPRHGGNYRSAPTKTSEEHKSKKANQIELKKNKEDADTSQTKFNKQIELDYEDEEESPAKMHGGNLKSISDYQNLPQATSRSAKLTKPSEENEKKNEFHRRTLRKKGEAKIKESVRRQQDSIESDEIREPETLEEGRDKIVSLAASTKWQPKDDRNKAASILTNFARAVPVLTTTPAYILDPSKRMYFYVDV